MSTVRVGINGMGRIGRAFLRQTVEHPRLEVVAVNDVIPTPTLARLLRRDSTWGPFGTGVEGDGDVLVVGDRKVAVSSMSHPELAPWRAHEVDLVIEASGRFRTRETAASHLAAGARRVLLSAPGKGVDATFVMGVNDHLFDPARHQVVSNASCTTNCVAPMVKVLHDSFGIEQGFMTTVHAYTNDQNLLDGLHKDPRRSRAAAVNIIPTSTGAARAVGEVLPDLAGRLDGVALRVPVVDGSLVDLAVVLDRDVTRDEVNAAFESAASEGPLSGRLRYETEPLVSSDVVLDPASCILDADLTQAAGRMVKAFGWYDNEWGYTARLVELAELVGSSADS
jgi:glyceraldehyde 3-phosphate dehydrogenase